MDAQSAVKVKIAKKGAAGTTALMIIVGVIIVGGVFYAGFLAGENSVLRGRLESPTGAVVQPPVQQPSLNQQPQQPTRADVETGGHVIGNPNAKVTVVEFGDYQCPFCKDFYQNSERQIVNDYVNTGKIKLAFRNFPLTSIHPFAENASEAAECAAKVGGNEAYWKYHDILYTNGSGDGTGLDPASLKQYAASLGLNAAAFNQCLDSHETAGIVQNDTAAGTAAGVQGTPTFYINGYQLVGALPYNNFKQAIDLVMNSTNATG
jgi:protein-disulfide isomerase